MEKRLQSIKLPRDLTLGGTKPRKTFTPNLNVARNKEKSNEFLIKTEDKRKRYNRKELRNKKFERLERFVQSSGIFSDGVGNDANKKARSERGHTFRDETPNVMPMPKVKKDEWQVDNKNETKVYDDIMGSNDLSDEDEKLPFAPLSWNEADFKETKVPITVKFEAKLEDANIQFNLTKLKINKIEVPKDFSESDSITDYNPALTLWSMPDSFSGKGLSDDPAVKTLFDYKLSGMLEGQIGRMLIRKSGKIDIFIGCVKYQIEPAHLESFREKLVQIDLHRSKECTGAAVGQLQNRFILNPDWAYLLTGS